MNTTDNPRREKMLRALTARADKIDARNALHEMLAGRPRQEYVSVTMPVLDEGSVLRASDRDYAVFRTGWRRCTKKGSAARRAAQSQIRLTAWASKNKYDPATEDLRHAEVLKTELSLLDPAERAAFVAGLSKRQRKFLEGVAA